MPRPKEFDPEVALDKAMHMFWHKGYEGTSMEDLLSAMDLNRGSLYDTFGDKRALFLKVMDRYCLGMMSERFAMLDQPGPALETLTQFITGMMEAALADPERRGCLVANTVMELAPHEKDIGARLATALKGMEERFFRVLTRAKKQGELSPEKDPRALGRFLTTMMQGTIVMIKAGTPAEAVRQTVKTGLSMLR